MAKIVIFGATGYIGTRLTEALLDEGHQVRVTFRDEGKLKLKNWYNHPKLETVYCNIFELETVINACHSCEIAYYLIHSMEPETEDFESADKIAARNMRQAAETASVSHLIYLGGVGNKQEKLSAHLRSRIEVAEIFRESSVDHTVLKAAIIIGGGSASFEILRYLVERLPVMITPTWVRTKSQPIAIRNVITYLVRLIDNPKVRNQTYEIGGPDVVSYEQLMQIYAKLAGLNRRLIIPVPVLSPRLSSYWVNFVTPISAELATPLIEGLRNSAITRDESIREVIPQKLLGIREAISRAVNERKYVITYQSLGKQRFNRPIEWSQQGEESWSGGPIHGDRRVLLFRGDKEKIWQKIIQLGGRNGYYYANFLWSIRGAIDRILGGPGLSRGRKDPNKIEAGDFLDFWRVMYIEEGTLLILNAEMKLPGIATLKFEIKSLSREIHYIDQIALFVPQGLLGVLYWKIVEPLHNAIFTGMLVKLAQDAEVTILKDPILIRRID